MTKYFIHIKLFFIALLSVMLLSCEEMIETEPLMSISDNVAMEDIAGVRSVLIGGYDRMQGSTYYGREIICVPEILADNCRITLQNSNRYISEANNAAGSHVSIWAAAYETINRVNNVLDYVDDVSDGTEAQRQQIKGEALFIRSLALHDLVKTYAREPQHYVNGFNIGVPLLTESFQGVEWEGAFPERATVEAVYAQIETDLTEAINLLGAESTVYRATPESAQALLARVYLYQGKWAEAAAAADAVIAGDGSDLASTEDYAQIFMAKPGIESIFELNYENTEGLSTNSIASIYSQAPDGTQGYGDICLTDDMFQQYNPQITDTDTTSQDVRFQLLRNQVKGPETVVYNLKYNSYNGMFGNDNLPLIRVSEMYLTAAEAYAESGNDAKALEYLNYIHQRAGLDALTGLSGAALIDAIITERRIELAFEGHRFYDLKRRGMDIPKNPVEGYNPVGLTWDDYRIPAKIPDSELGVNPNLVQNPGY